MTGFESDPGDEQAEPRFAGIATRTPFADVRGLITTLEQHNRSGAERWFCHVAWPDEIMLDPGFGGAMPTGVPDGWKRATAL